MFHGPENGGLSLLLSHREDKTPVSSDSRYADDIKNDALSIGNKKKSIFV